jgi:signal peptidase
MQFVEQTIALIIIVGSALALWKSLCVSFNTECPVVVVLTGSMEPGYYRGDILFVYKSIYEGPTGMSPLFPETFSCTV